MHPQSLAEEEVKTESDAVEGMEISTRSKVSDPGSVERAAQKRKVPSPPHSSNGHSPAETSPSPVKKKKKPGAVSSSKDQSELRHGPFYYVKQPALTTDPVDVVPQDGRNDFYCWLCHREGQVLCCELCPRVYHAKCLKLPAEPEGDWFCPECEVLACGWDRKPVVYQEDNFRTLKCMGGWGLRLDHDDRHPYFMEFTELRKILELQEILTMLV
ncbi:protein kinase C-binding protein 1-like [Oncorhynchus mykiss]|uniref:protein kinase C-binding protein 1-like n=1 Tax=Oncorhynchus mykiss TaxID=8022 RepID=UPI00113089E4|nr:protein kinase C-binding protein 1-like [Oncorhynchus nerka]XP_036806509.1 protein kinase C-binding protein 1-like [Oncorhynchus mykiss]